MRGCFRQETAPLPACAPPSPPFYTPVSYTHLDVYKRQVDSGAGEVVVNSIDTDGVRRGFDLEMLRAVGEAVSVPIIASGGAGCREDFLDVFRLDCVDAGLAASIFHSREVDIRALKRWLNENGVPMRLVEDGNDGL